MNGKVKKPLQDWPEWTVLIMLVGGIALIIAGAAMGGEGGTGVIALGVFWFIAWYFIACYAYEQRHAEQNQAMRRAAMKEIESIYKKAESSMYEFLDGIRLEDHPDIAQYSEEFIDEIDKRYNAITSEVNRTVRLMEARLHKLYVVSEPDGTFQSSRRREEIMERMKARITMISDKIGILVEEKEEAKAKEERRREFQEFVKEHGSMDVTELEKQFAEWKDKKDKI